MSRLNDMHTAVDRNIYTNGRGEITASMVQSVLHFMIDQLGSGAQFAGIAVPGTEPDEDSDILTFYLATQPGTYTGFGGITISTDNILYAITNLFSSEWQLLTICAISSGGASVLTRLVDGVAAQSVRHVDSVGTGIGTGALEAGVGCSAQAQYSAAFGKDNTVNPNSIGRYGSSCFGYGGNIDSADTAMAVSLIEILNNVSYPRYPIKVDWDGASSIRGGHSVVSEDYLLSAFDDTFDPFELSLSKGIDCGGFDRKLEINSSVVSRVLQNVEGTDEFIINIGGLTGNTDSTRYEAPPRVIIWSAVSTAQVVGIRMTQVDGPGQNRIPNGYCVKIIVPDSYSLYINQPSSSYTMNMHGRFCRFINAHVNPGSSSASYAVLTSSFIDLMHYNGVWYAKSY